MQTAAVPFRLGFAKREAQLTQFNARSEVQWFGFEGAFREPGVSVIRFAQLGEGSMGGGGTSAINGGVIAGGFDAAFVLIGLGHYDSEVVVTLELSVKFLSLAIASSSLAFQAHFVRSAKNFAFAEGFLSDTNAPNAGHYAIATAMVAPGR